MKTFTNIVLGAAVGCVAASLVIHRHVWLAVLKGEPIPEPPAWHVWHPAVKNANQK